ncbi:MAG: spike base protein, RCAP_Rcc01079 family [Pseudomonadota bacterium]
MADDFASHETSLISPIQDADPVVPSDSLPLPKATRGIYVAASGDLRVRLVSGATVTFAAVPAGSVLPVRVTQVMATGTTAAGIVGLR